MIRIEDGLYWVLTNNIAVAALVGIRMYPIELPQNPTLPAITYQVITPSTGIAHDGLTGVGDSRYQFNGIDDNYDVVIDLMNKVRKALGGYKGTAGTAPNTVVIEAILPVGVGYEAYDPQIKRYSRSLDFYVWHLEET